MKKLGFRFKELSKLTAPQLAAVFGALIAIVLAYVAMDGSTWLCTDYKTDWTAVGIFIALATAIVGWKERQDRINATAMVVAALLLVEFERLGERVARLRDTVLPRMIPDGPEGIAYEVSMSDIAESETMRKALRDALAEIETPTLTALIDKLDTLPPTFTRRISRVLTCIDAMRAKAQSADDLKATGVDDARHRLSAEYMIDQIDDLARQVPKDLFWLRKDLAEYFGLSEEIQSEPAVGDSRNET